MYSHKLKIVIIILATFCQRPSLYAQSIDTLLIKPQQIVSDSLKKDSLSLKSDSIKYTPVFKIKYTFPKSWTINWDSRSSFISEKPVNIWGINVALIHGEKRHQITLGYYWLTYNSLLRLIDLSKGAASLINLDYYTKRDLYYISTMYWWNFINNKDFKFSMPLEVGMGATANSGSTLKNDFLLWERNDFFMPVQAGLFFGWNATRWAGLSVQGGYRYALIQHDIKQNYNSIYYSFGVSLHTEILTDIYEYLFKKKNNGTAKQ